MSDKSFEELYPKLNEALKSIAGIKMLLRVMIERSAKVDPGMAAEIEAALPNHVAPTVYTNPNQNTGVNY